MIGVHEWSVPPARAHVFMVEIKDGDEFWDWCKLTMKGKFHMNNGTSGMTLLNSPNLPRHDYTTPYHMTGYYGHWMVLVEDDKDAMLFKLKWMV